MKRTLIALVLFVISCSTAPLQHGSITGTVTMDGAPIPGATVLLLSTGARATTDANGRYTFANIPVGQYAIRTSLEGFNTVTQSVTVRERRAAPVSTALGVSAVTEAITVTAMGPAIELERRYAKIEEHGFVETKKERTTTFAIDVDRASYTNIRRFLTEGHAPPPDAVRIEEMLNYFTYSYPQPENGAPFSVTTEVAGCPWNAKNRLLRVGIQGRNLEEWRMAANNLVFLIDVSGSMSEELPLVQQAFRVLVEELRAEDRVAVVVYAGAAGLVLPSTSGADKSTILAAIDNLRAGGSTAGGEGIELAYAVANKNFIEGGNNRVVLATDGDFNVGVSSTQDLEKLIEKKRESDIFLSVVGVGGANYNDAGMETLADKGNGNYAYLDSIAEAEKVFRHELTGTLVTIAKDVKVQLEFDPATVASYRQIGYENRALDNEDFVDDKKDAGELGAGHSVTALFEIVPAAGASVPAKLATLRLRYKEPIGRKSRELIADAVDSGRSAYEASPDLQFAAAVTSLGMLLRDSPHKGSTTWDDVFQLARVSQGVDLDGTRAEFVQLAMKAKEMK